MSDLHYAGDRGQGEILFDLSFWIRCQQQLATADALMRLVAIGGPWTFIANGAKGWPSRILRRRRLLVIEEVRLMLNPQYLQDDEVYYCLSHVVVKRLPWPWAGGVSDREVACYTPDEVGSVNRLREDLEGLTGPVWQPRSEQT